MHINPYGSEPVRLAVELANDPPSTQAELRDLCAEHGVILDRAPTATDVADVRELIGRWCAVVDAVDAADRADQLNIMLAHHVSHPRITDHAGDGWHLHYRGPDPGVAAQLAALILTGTALHLTERGMTRLSRCASSDCDLIFADLSRNGRQRYCSPRCGSREAVRRHRAG